MYFVVRGFQSSLPSANSLVSTGWQLAATVAVGATVYVGAVFVLWRICQRPKGSESAILGLLRRRSA